MILLLYYFFAAILLFFSFKSFRGGIHYLRFFQSELAKPNSAYTPFVSVIAPCRGAEPGLEKNLHSLFVQDYTEFEIIFVVDDESDPAFAIISALIEARNENQPDKNPGNNCTARIVVAQKATNSSQKVENLREAVQHISNRSEAIVFVDSDARPGGRWLRSLVAPLQDKSTGAATGYRWFMAARSSFGAEMRSVWNASIASALGPETKTNFCWGGSMAVRRDTFERLDIREKWKGTLSDDFAVTRAVKGAGLPIHFVPRALTASLGECSIAEMFEFTTRQMKITRVNSPNLWKLSFFGSVVFNLVMLASLAIIVVSKSNSTEFYVSISVFATVSVLSTGKSWLRLKAVKLVLSDYALETRHQSVTQNTLWILGPAVFMINCVAAMFSRRIMWRGITYELKSPTETVIIAD